MNSAIKDRLRACNTRAEVLSVLRLYNYPVATTLKKAIPLVKLEVRKQAGQFNGSKNVLVINNVLNLGFVTIDIVKCEYVDLSGEKGSYHVYVVEKIY